MGVGLRLTCIVKGMQYRLLGVVGMNVLIINLRPYLL